MMNIMVTGCSGFVGLHVCKELLIRGYNIVGISRTRPKNILDNKFSFYEADITNKESLKNVFSTNQIDCIIHLAAYIPNKDCDYERCIATNYNGFFNILELARNYSVTNLIFASSQRVYQENLESPIIEDTHLKPSTIYGLSKKQGEELSEYYALNYDINTIILRLSGIYGGGKEKGVVYNFIKQALKNENLFVNQKNKTKDIVYIKDVTKLIIKSLEKIRNIKYEILNSGGVSISLYDLAKKIIELTDSNSDIILKEDKTMNSFQLSMAKSKQIFNHDPQRLEDSLNEIINIMKQH